MQTARLCPSRDGPGKLQCDSPGALPKPEKDWVVLHVGYPPKAEGTTENALTQKENALPTAASILAIGTVPPVWILPKK